MDETIIYIRKQDNYDANDPIVVAVREEMLRRLIERNHDFRVDWLAEAEKFNGHP